MEAQKDIQMRTGTPDEVGYGRGCFAGWPADVGRKLQAGSRR